MTREPGGRAARVVALLALVSTLALAAVAGCAADDDDAAQETAEDMGDEASAPGVPGQAPAPDAEESAGGADADSSGAARVEGAVDTAALAREREVVRTGSMQLTVDDVDEAIADIRQAATDASGFVADEQVLVGEAEASITVRVPTDRFDDVRDEVAGLGDLVEQTVEARDVTTEMVDVETRIESLRKSVERLQAMLGRAGDVAQLAAVESELARREVELEAMLGQQRVLEDQVSLGTLRIDLSEDEPPEPDEDAPSFGDGFRQGWVALVDAGRVAVAVIGFLLPFAAVLAVVGIPARWLATRRRIRRGRGGSGDSGDSGA